MAGRGSLLLFPFPTGGIVANGAGQYIDGIILIFPICKCGRDAVSVS